MRRYILLRQSEGWRHKSLYHLRTLIDGQLVPVRGGRTLIHSHNSGTTCLRVYVPSQKMILTAWLYHPYHFVGQVLLHSVYRILHNYNYTGKNHLILPENQITSPVLRRKISYLIFILRFFLLSGKSGETFTVVEQAAARASVTQRAWVRSPIETSFLGEVFFSGFFLTCRTNVRKLSAPRSPNIIWPS